MKRKSVPLNPLSPPQWQLLTVSLVSIQLLSIRILCIIQVRHVKNVKKAQDSAQKLLAKEKRARLCLCLVSCCCHCPRMPFSFPQRQCFSLTGPSLNIVTAPWHFLQTSSYRICQNLVYQNQLGTSAWPTELENSFSARIVTYFEVSPPAIVRCLEIEAQLVIY